MRLHLGDLEKKEKNMEDLIQKHKKRGENDKGLRWGQSLQVRRKVKMSSRKRVYEEMFQAGRSQLSQLVKWRTSYQVMPRPHSQKGQADLVLWILFRHFPSPVPEEDSSANSREVKCLFIPYLVQSQRWVFLSNEGSLTSPGSWGRGTAGTSSLCIGASVR